MQITTRDTEPERKNRSVPAQEQRIERGRPADADRPEGTPGGQTEAQPISLDAIQELQLVVSPYDVRQGGFSGGGINAITKSGSNALRGTAYFYGRNQDWVGEAPNGTKIGQFKDQQFGGSVGGPIVRSRAFFFGNVDWTRKDNPSGLSVDSTGQQFGRTAEVERFISILQNRYNYNAGGKEEFIRTLDSNKFFVRADVNVSPRHQLTVRHNYLDALNDIGRPTTSAMIEVQTSDWAPPPTNRIAPRS